MPYEYDVFFSYKRDLQSDDWHEKVKTKLEFWLKHELQQQKLRIFFDTEEIRTGMRWRQKLVVALKQSRCIVCMWSPLYFQSKWCVSEWMTFVKREEQEDRELVMPASYFDGEAFPARATAKQFLDFSEYTSTMPKFWETEPAVRFEAELLRPFARDLAAMIRSAPDFDDGFPVVEVPDSDVDAQGTIGRPADV